MSVPHHGPEEEAARKRLIEQFTGTAKRQWPKGRVGGDDDGELSFAIAADPRHGVIKIVFGKEVSWLGLDLEAATKLRDLLSEKILELRGITT